MAKNQLKSGVILSYINLAIGTIIPFIYTPVMLRILGQSEYGLYSLSSSVIGYLSLLSFGLGSTIIRYLSKYRAEKNKDMEQRVIGLFIILYSILAVVVLFCGVYIYSHTDMFFGRGLNAVELSKMKILVLIMTFNTAISFPISVFSSITIAHEKYIFRKLVDMLSTVAVPVFNIVVLYMGFGSVGMACVSTLLQFMMLPLNVIYCFRVLKTKPIFRNIPFYLIKEICAFSFYVFLGTIVDMLFWATDKVLLGSMVGTVAVAIYNVGGTFNSMMTNLSTSISGVLVPKVTAMVVTKNSKDNWTELFIRIGRLQYYIIALVITGFIVFGRQFVSFIAGNGYEESYIVALITMIPLVVPLIQNVGLNILVAQNKHKFRSIVYLIIAIVNVVTTYLCIPHLGIIGAALCSGISYIIGQGLIMNIYYYKVTGIDILKFWKNIIKISIIPFIQMIIGLFISKMVNFYKPTYFIFGVLIYSILYCLLSYFISMNDYEKDIFRKPIKTFCKKLKYKY